MYNGALVAMEGLIGLIGHQGLNGYKAQMAHIANLLSRRGDKKAHSLGESTGLILSMIFIVAMLSVVCL